jgi:hypothetical protein
MNTDNVIALAIFAIGVSLNAGIVWKGLTVVEQELAKLRQVVQEQAEDMARARGGTEADLRHLQEDVEQLKKKAFFG